MLLMLNAAVALAISGAWGMWKFLQLTSDKATSSKLSSEYTRSHAPYKKTMQNTTADMLHPPRKRNSKYCDMVSKAAVHALA